MKIQALKQNTYKPNFQAYFINDYYPIGKGQYLNEYKDEIVNSHETYFFRNDVNWLAFKDYINDRFGNLPKVDTIIYACSFGFEPYSLSMLLQSTVQNPERFFPIRAFDIDESLILDNISKKNSFKIEDSDLSKIRDFYEKAGLDCAPYIFQGDFGKYYLTNKTTKPVEFRDGNLIADVDRMQFERPVLFMARNMWPYVAPDEYSSFARKLFSKLPYRSSVIIGEFDYMGNRYLGTNDFPNVLMEAGFRQTGVNVSRDILRKNIIFEKNRF